MAAEKTRGRRGNVLRAGVGKTRGQCDLFKQDERGGRRAGDSEEPSGGTKRCNADLCLGRSALPRGILIYSLILSEKFSSADKSRRLR
eukprot:755547-Hanusia_phi.AAC.3